MLRRQLLNGMLLATLAGAACAEPVSKPESKITAWLELTGWPPERFEQLAGESTLDESDELDLIALAERFRRLPEADIQAAAIRLTDDRATAAELQPGGVVTIRGVATSATRVPASSRIPRYRLTVEVGESADAVAASTIEVLTPSAPARWFAEQETVALREPIACDGIVVRSTSDGLLLVTPRIRWLPSKADGVRVRYGEALLGGAGVDIGLLDTLADGKGLTADEAEPFYRTLAACGAFTPGQLVRAAADDLPRYEKRWEKELTTKGAKQKLARAAIRQTREGRYPVAPLFNDAADQRGGLFAFEGLARRAVRIDLTRSRDGQPSRVPTRYGIDHYYEIEVFPPDSQNLPLTFCVLELPDRFPTGDAIQERVRVAGFFLKRWAYRTRKPGDQPGGGDRRQLSPLLVGREPIWLPDTPNDNHATQIYAGFAFVGVMAIVAFALWRQSQADRRFERATLNRYKTGKPPSEDVQR